jgi:hypothetical protein
MAALMQQHTKEKPGCGDIYAIFAYIKEQKRKKDTRITFHCPVY